MATATPPTTEDVEKLRAQLSDRDVQLTAQAAQINRLITERDKLRSDLDAANLRADDAEARVKNWKIGAGIATAVAVAAVVKR